MAPYLAGAKNAACVPIKNTVLITSQGPTGVPPTVPR